MTHIPSIGSVMTPFPYVVQVDDSLLLARTLMVEHSHLGPQRVATVTSLPR